MSDVRKRFTTKQGFCPKVVEYMNYLIDTLEKKYGAIRLEWIVTLDLMAKNFQIIEDSYNEIASKGNTVPDARGRLQKNPAINMMNNAQNFIQKQMKLMGWFISTKDEEDTHDENLAEYEADLCGD